MEARDFLDQNKRRMMRIAFPAFSMYDTYAGLLDVSLSETMSTVQDITIGEIVVPELTFRTAHTDFTPFFGDIIHLDSALEETREDITEELHTITETLDSGQLVFARSITGFWVVGDGTSLYSLWFGTDGSVQQSDTLTASKPIEAVTLCESIVNTDADGILNTTGVAYLLHSVPPYVTPVFFRSPDRNADGLIAGCRFGSAEDDRPDVDGDGFVTAADSALILTAAAHIGAGEPSGLTPEQELRADADRDGSISPLDAQLVDQFTAAVGAGDYTDDADGWLAFLTASAQGYDTESEPGLAILTDTAAAHGSQGTASVYRSGVKTHDLITRLDIRTASHYENGILQRYPAYGTAYSFRPASYGRFCMTELSSRDEETTNVLCSGILWRTVGLNASGFFTPVNFACSNFAELFANFCRWLTAEGIPVEPAQQTYLNLSGIAVTAPDWESEDFSTVTADTVLKEFAFLEGGNARLDREDKLRLGWCGTEPVLTVSAEVLGSLRLGNEKLLAATGIDPFWNPESRNVIRTELDGDALVLGRCTGILDLTYAYQRITAQFSAGTFPQIAFDGELLCGASPFLRVGDSLRAVSRSGMTVTVQLMEQTVREFPAMQADLSAPDGTGWETEPISGGDIVSITVENYPPFVILGELPDISGMVVTAHQSGGGSFTVDPSLVRIRLGTPESNGRILMQVWFAGRLAASYIQWRAKLLTHGGQPLLTHNQDYLGGKKDGNGL